MKKKLILVLCTLETNGDIFTVSLKLLLQLQKTALDVLVKNFRGYLNWLYARGGT